ncbi:MAG: copper amine oxidase N-terminal domain-containing protein [Armatimonadota bacterium]
MKRAAAVVVAIALLSVSVCAQDDAPANVQVTVNDTPVTFTEPVLVVNMDYPLLPAQTFVEALGANSDWDPGAQQLDVQSGDTTLVMWVDRDWVTVDGTRQELPGGLQTFNRRPYVHAAETARRLGFNARWDAEALTLDISRAMMMPRGPTVAATLLEMPETGVLLVRLDDTGQLREIPLADDVVVQRGPAEGSLMAADLDHLQQGDQLEVVLNDAGTAVGVRASYTQALGTIASIEDNQLTLQSGESYPLGEGVRAVGSDGQPLHLLGAVGQGAILTLNPDSGAVWQILAQRRGTVTPPDTEAPVIAAFTLPRYEGPLGEGSGLNIRIVGTGDASASVQLGAEGPTVSVPETDPGIYSGTMEIPADLLITDDHILATLEEGEESSPTVPSSRAVMVDSQQPVFHEPVPADEATVADANTHIRVSFGDGDGVGIDPNTAQLSLDGTDVTAESRIEADHIFYAPPEGLTTGAHQATASVADELGNAATHTWEWTIGEAEAGIQTVSHDAEEALTPGDTLTVTMTVAAPGRDASFSINGVADDIAMTRVEGTNTYEGSYTVQEADAAAEATVTASFTAADGAEYQSNAAAPVTITVPEVEFAITTPAEGAETGRRIRPAGTAPPGSRVRWTINYQKVILTGEVRSRTATADADGIWEAAEQVDLRLMLFGMADQYTLTAELLDADGAVVQTKSVQFEADD